MSHVALPGFSSFHFRTQFADDAQPGKLRRVGPTQVLGLSLCFQAFLPDPTLAVASISWVKEQMRNSLFAFQTHSKNSLTYLVSFPCSRKPYKSYGLWGWEVGRYGMLNRQAKKKSRQALLGHLCPQMPSSFIPFHSIIFLRDYPFTNE